MRISLPLPLVLLIVASQCLLADQKCQAPQKGVFLSYNALSKRDAMPNVFKQINTQTKVFSTSYSESNTVYNLTNISPKLYYNEHSQVETFVDAQQVKVTLGDIYLELSFNYQIIRAKDSKNGTGTADVILEQNQEFVKKIIQVDEYLEWQPVSISNLSTTHIFNVIGSNLDDDERSMLTNILSDHIPTIKIRATIFQSLNTIYSSILKKHLNSERVISDTAISYRYNNQLYTFTNGIKNYTLHNDTAKGLEVFFNFGIDGEIEQCASDKIDFNPKFMGVQEWYSIKSLKAAFITALGKGLFTVKLDRKWEGQAFQFYIGDLANAIPFANKFAADLPIQVSCQWSGEKNFQFQFHQRNQLYTSVEVECMVNFQGKDILFAEFDLTLVIEVIALDDTLRFKVAQTGLFSPKFKSVDPNYIVEQKQYLSFAIASVIATMEGSYVFGTGWKTSNRKFPSLDVTNDYVIVYDPSEK